MFYLALRKTAVPREQWTVSLATHLAWMEQQHRAGHILLSGPTTDRALSMYLIKTDSREEAERIAAADPFTAAGLCTFDLIEWNIHQAFGIGDFTGGNRAAAPQEAPAR